MSSRAQKRYTQNLGDGKTIVISGYRWIYSIRVELTSDLKGSKDDFLHSLKDKDFYIEDVNWTSHNGDAGIIRYHGPYPIEEITADSYMSIELDEAIKLLELTMDNPDFIYDFPFDQEYKNEAISLLQSSMEGKDEIYWLSKKIEKGRMDYWFRYGFWAEFVARDENELVYITIGED